MREQLEARVAELNRELEVGQKRLQELEVQQATLHETMLRILGAKQVLDELLADEAAGNGRAEGVDVPEAAEAAQPA